MSRGNHIAKGSVFEYSDRRLNQPTTGAGLEAKQLHSGPGRKPGKGVSSMAIPAIEQSELVAGVRFQKIGKLYHFNYSAHPELKQGDYVIVDTRRGRQMGQVMGFTESDPGRDARSILRPATPRDMVLRQHWESQQDEALERCREAANNLRRMSEVKFVAAQYNYDGSAITFLFSAEQKIDTTVLQKRLQRKFEARVDMRQIGPRDVAKLLGRLWRLWHHPLLQHLLDRLQPHLDQNGQGAGHLA